MYSATHHHSRTLPEEVSVSRSLSRASRVGFFLSLSELKHEGVCVFFLRRVNTFGGNAAVGGHLGRVWSGVGGHHARSRAHHHHGLHNLATEISLGQHLVLQKWPTHNLEGRLQQKSDPFS